MQFITDAQVHSVVTMRDAIETLRIAMRDLGERQANIQPRMRIAGGGVTLSTMASIIPALGVAGAKVYTTLNGVFDFLVPLYSTESGKLTAVVHGGALTEYRTAAVSRIAFDAVGSAESRVLAVFGTGVQAKAHIKAFLEGTNVERVMIVNHEFVSETIGVMSALYPHVSFEEATALAAVQSADIVVTASRSNVPLFDGRDLREDAFVAAIGSSKPNSREIDDATLTRASRIIVESVEQARVEAGDLLLAESGVVEWDSVKELGLILASGNSDGPAAGIQVFKSIGIALADVALGEFVRRRVIERAVQES